MMKTITAKTPLQDFQIAIVVSQFNTQVTDKLLEGALSRLKELHFPENAVTVAKVPGAVEIPLTAKKLALTKKYKAVLCLGAVIYGETDHYTYVCQQVSDGCQRVALDTDVPIIFEVLTTKNEALALDRAGGKVGNKGREAVDTAIEMISVMEQI